ncbi:site-specific integrase [Hymenobacter jejuensis]|uniref:Tyr recombinase domain-containing protein n=1 Tax=Hymenobacter jejuensis TaxID=2502781 RepID=A0A5B8A3E0_9BACT|nr:hypothetical protein [Hymenobacter jejuensis]QDA61954.1 hypothetical protein FHG12_18440 [Hymenobacter jejuensis]
MRTARVGLQNNTISTYLRSIRTLLKYAGLAYDWIEHDFLEDVEREPLTYEEVMQLYRFQPLEVKEGSTNYASRKASRDVFVFNCLTGPRYDNLAHLKPWDVILETFTSKDGKTSQRVPILEYIQRKGQRLKRKVRVALDPVAYEIWQKYKGHLPVPSNQTMNGIIKQLCRAAGLKRLVTVVRGSGARRLESELPLWKVVSCHIARYTFITLQFEGGADVVYIQDSVGNASLNTTRKYLKSRVKDRHTSTLAAFDVLRERANGPK